MKNISLDALNRFVIQILTDVGISKNDADTIAQVLIETDTFGVLSHGTKNLYGYVTKIKAGGIDPHAVPEIEKEGPSWAMINGHAAMGMVSSCKAMELAIKKAKETGVGYVGVRNSCHFGAAGYYSNLAACKNMIGLSMSNTDPNMAIPGSSNVAIGNNPFSYAAPDGKGKSIFLDIALSNVAALKVVMAKEKNTTVPAGWLIDENGQGTCDPSGFPEKSHLLPMGNHKGYGLAIMVELLASILTGAGIMSEVRSWNLDLPSRNNVGHAFLAIDVAQMMPLGLFEERVKQMVDELKQAPKAVGGKILVPGEMEWTKRDAALKSGELTLNDAMVTNMEILSEMYHTPITWLD